MDCLSEGSNSLVIMSAAVLSKAKLTTPRPHTRSRVPINDTVLTVLSRCFVGLICPSKYHQ